MAKLTLSFKGRLLSIHHLDEHPMTIGRDSDCRICIDSLAVAPRHAELMPMDTAFLLLALDPEYPVLLNNEQVDQASVHHGDLIGIGKHTLIFSEDTLELSAPPSEIHGAPQEDPGVAGDAGAEPVQAYLQVQSGPQLGRVIVFQRSVTRLNRIGAADVIVTRRGGSYHISCLGGEGPIRIGGERIKYMEETELHDNDLIEIADVRLRFFCNKARTPASKAKAN
jgi:hypothetical protein